MKLRARSVGCRTDHRLLLVVMYVSEDLIALFDEMKRKLARRICGVVLPMVLMKLGRLQGETAFAGPANATKEH